MEGKANLVADALSRPNEELLDFNAISEEAMFSRQEKASTTSSLDRQIRLQSPPVPIFCSLQPAASSQATSASVSNSKFASLSSSSNQPFAAAATDTELPREFTSETSNQSARTPWTCRESQNLIPTISSIPTYAAAAMADEPLDRAQPKSTIEFPAQAMETLA